LTTPGAGKWYRSAGPWARQRLVFAAEKDTCVEWLPQETIIFDGALAEMSAEIRLAANAVYLGWEVLCLGRIGSGERYATGECRPRTEIWRDGKLLWYERGRIEAGGLLAGSPVGLNGRSVCGTFLAAAPGVTPELVALCRAEQAESGDAAITLLPSLFVARYLGDSGEAARAYFTRLWRVLRPALAGCKAQEPRIWST
jgi:urease accessory protein